MQHSSTRDATGLTPWAPRLALTGFAIEMFKGFEKRQDVELAPITCIIGKNNAGKSSLLRVPLLLTQLFRPLNWSPFELDAEGLDLGGSVQEMCFQQSPRGFQSELRFELEGVVHNLRVHALQENPSQQQRVASLTLMKGGMEAVRCDENEPWHEIAVRLNTLPQLIQLSRSVVSLKGIREAPRRRYSYRGAMPQRPGVRGQWAPEMLAALELGEHRDVLNQINDWMQRIAGVSLRVAIGQGELGRFSGAPSSDFSLLVERGTSSRGARINLVDTGEGIGQVLPLVTSLCVHPLLHSPPSLYVLEQPELHLHPHAHPEVAELLIDLANRAEEGAGTRGGAAVPRILLETHSDVLLLRLRRALAERRLKPHQLVFYYVEPEAGGVASTARKLTLSDRGVTDWWPKGIFAEDQAEYYAIRQALLKRDDAS